MLLRHYLKMKFAATLVLFTVFCCLEGALGYPRPQERQQGESHHRATSQRNYNILLMRVYIIAIKESCQWFFHLQNTLSYYALSMMVALVAYSVY